MSVLGWQTVQKLREVFRETTPPPEQIALRLQAMERDIILPVKAVFVGVLCYYLYFTRWFEDVALARTITHQIIQRFFLFYLLANVAVAAILLFIRRWPGTVLQRVIFSSNFLDGLFLATLTFVTGGFDSILYWLFLGLIIRNAISCPLAVPQLLLNFSMIFCYLLAGVADVAIPDDMLGFEDFNRSAPENPTEPFLLRLIVLCLFTLCCYGVQVLLEKQRHAGEETREFTARQEQLRSAGRLAAEIAHQIKNPLGIINNAAWSLQKAAQDGRPPGPRQVQIIREEIDRADRIITELMGYAQLAEGRVERLQPAHELDRALAQVFPPGTHDEVLIERRYGPHLPALLMQRGHLAEIFVNVLQNAREAIGDRGRVEVVAAEGKDHSVVIRVSDDGPGIPPDRLEKVFEAYYSTKEKGTGLGLAIVKHNAALYGGAVRVESELGKGSAFIVELPTKTFMKSPA